MLGTQGESWAIARAVAFLVSDDARWITGQVLTVDGGASLKRGELWPEAFVVCGLVPPAGGSGQAGGPRANDHHVEFHRLPRW